MAGYVVSARIIRAEAHRREAPRRPLAGTSLEPGDLPPGAPRPESVDLVGAPFGERFSDMVAGLGAAWSQMVFFLFDPESWRR